RTATGPDTAPSRKRTGGRAAAGATLRDRVLDWPRSRSSFVLVLMALMIVGVAVTLWLSTQAIADSWRLQELREGNTELTERVERLQREVGQLQSPSSLAERAEALGMVPAGPAARLVEDADGDVTVVGDPEAATPPPDGSGTAVDGAAGTGGADDGT
ncbi:hypothetical protein, partial [Saccharomonospora iraqiensis]|uniref:hypothetical protein n=1 Tax=Saccharomonospora iraqiensis TaxID=52698 RepID=UPI00022E07BD